jgi:hypothetical protein
MFEGADIAFDFNFQKKIETTLPENGVDSTVFNVLDLAGSIIFKRPGTGKPEKLKGCIRYFRADSLQRRT